MSYKIVKLELEKLFTINMKNLKSPQIFRVWKYFLRGKGEDVSKVRNSFVKLELENLFTIKLKNLKRSQKSRGWKYFLKGKREGV